MIGDAMGASLLEFELKRAIGISGGSGHWRDAPDKEPSSRKPTGLLSLEIATALGFNARHV
ncbi:hypothetical protein NKJ36_04240 [Mesorhizobium sp. M0142]|uniref:hypothetical protein n=1 Tax=unclassified Mesorhizobium TaxID=325217 RepID=UPI003336BA67